uniref:Dihydrouridine synthase 2 n=1 Tax=Takifugu rubripes TaxID=31033 RepID=A0A674MY55_TAKRU
PVVNIRVLCISQHQRLGPMVRVGTLPMRLLLWTMEADVVYCEELIDIKMAQCHRVVNGERWILVAPDERVMFRTCEREKNKVVFQMVRQSHHKASPVLGFTLTIILNRELLIRTEPVTVGGMGAALLADPDKIEAVSTDTLFKLPSNDLEDTISLVQRIEKTGVAAIAVHGRFKEERPRHPVHCDYIRTIARSVSIPVIGSLDLVKTNSDIEDFRVATGTSSVMLARAAMWNVSIFSKRGPFPVEKAIRYENHAFNTKYCLCQMLRDKVESPLGKQVQTASPLLRLSEAYGILGFYQQTQEWIQSRRNAQQNISQLDEPIMEGDVITMAVKFERGNYVPPITPKMLLLEWTHREKLEQPLYETKQRPQDRAFQSVVTVAQKKYRSSLWEKSKKLAEQAAAIVCLRVLGLHEGRIGEEDSGLVCKRKREASVFSDDSKEDRNTKRQLTDIQMEIAEATADIDNDLLNHGPPEKPQFRNHVDDKTSRFKSVK